MSKQENGFALNGRRIIATGANATASLFDGLATPWLFAAIYPFFTAYVWRWYSPASATRIGALYTALWIIEGFLLIPAVRRIAGGSSRALVIAAFVVPLLRFNVIWGSTRFGALEIFILLERAVSWTVFVGSPARPGKISSRLARYFPWFFGVMLGSGMVAMAARWLEKDASAYLALAGAAGLVSALLKALSVQMAKVTEPAAGLTPVAEESPPPAKHWVPLTLIFAVLAVAGLLPRELDYLSPDIGRHLLFWEPLARSMWIAALATLVLLPAKRFRSGFAAGVLLILLSAIPGLTGTLALTLLGTGLGVLALCLIDGSPGEGTAGTRPGRTEMFQSAGWAVGTIACFRGIGVLTLEFTFSRWLMAGVALAAVLAMGLSWREGSRPAGSAEAAKTG